MEPQTRAGNLIPNHLGIIMDGNGRWADKISSVAETCADFGIQVLTLYAFSTGNRSRPAPEWISSCVCCKFMPRTNC